MSKEIARQATASSDVRLSFPKIALFFDGVDYIIERITQSVLSSKMLLVVLLALFLFACELIRFAIFVLKGH